MYSRGQRNMLDDICIDDGIAVGEDTDAEGDMWDDGYEGTVAYHRRKNHSRGRKDYGKKADEGTAWGKCERPGSDGGVGRNSDPASIRGLGGRKKRFFHDIEDAGKIGNANENGVGGGRAEKPKSSRDGVSDEYGGNGARTGRDGRVKRTGRVAKSNFTKSIRTLIAVNITLAVIIVSYVLIVFVNLPIIAPARDLWIETAMTTADHQWLATAFFPRALINSVMANQVATDEDQISNPGLVRPNIGNGGGVLSDGTESNVGVNLNADSNGGASAGEGSENGVPGAKSAFDAGAEGGMQAGTGVGSEGLLPNDIFGFLRPGNSENQPEAGDATGGDRSDEMEGGEPRITLPRVGEKDAQGNTVIVSDMAEELHIVEVKASNALGRIMFIQDPSRVVVKHTDRKNVSGEFIGDFLEQYDAVGGINGNGFMDPEGHGRGGDIIGWSVSGGEVWGTGSKTAYASVGLNEDHVLVVGSIKDFEQHNIRDLAQYGPTLIIDGKKNITGSGGWGLQPRSAIGQCADGTIMLATFDGRSLNSIGITAGEIADIFFEYGCVNAGLCDGGSSSVMMYEDKVISVPSGPQKDTGRYLPNAFIVLSKNKYQT